MNARKAHLELTIELRSLKNFLELALLKDCKKESFVAEAS